mgnify:FL=1
MSSDEVTDQEFRNFSGKLLDTYPGIQSLSWNQKVMLPQRAEFENYIRTQGFPNFEIWERLGNGQNGAAGQRPVYFPVTYTVTSDNNQTALGYDTYSIDAIAGDIRSKTLDRARDESAVMATSRISLVQAENEYGIIFYNPVYGISSTLNDVIARRENLIGYTAGVFIVRKMMEPVFNLLKQKNMILVMQDLSAKQNNILYDTRSSDFKENPHHPPVSQNRIQTKINVSVAGHEWEMHFIQNDTKSALSYNWSLWYILIVGLMFSGLLGAMLLIISANTENARRSYVRGQGESALYIIPVMAGMLTFAIAGLTYVQMAQEEKSLVVKSLTDELDSVKKAVNNTIRYTIIAQRRMALRWQSRNGIPENEWNAEALNLLNDTQALTTLQWVDRDFHVRWVQPLEKNENIIGLDVTFNGERRTLIEEAMTPDTITMTPPINLVQGYKAIICYIPLYPNQSFDGFITGIYDLDLFFKNSLSAETREMFNIEISDGKAVVYTQTGEDAARHEGMAIQSDIVFFNRIWTVRVWPTSRFMETQKSYLPLIILLGGMFMSVLIGFAIYYAMAASRQTRLLHIKANELKNSEQQFRTAMENSAIGMALVSPEGKWLTVNVALVEILGYTRDELMNIDFQTITHPDDLEGDLKRLKKILAGDISTYQMEKRYYHKDGHIVWALLNVSTVRDDDGDIIYFISQIQDITQRKEIEIERNLYTTQMEIAREEATRANIMKSEFLANMSHEIRTPLNGVIGAADLLRSNTKITQKQDKYLEAITNSGDTLLSLINDILDLSKIEAGEMDIHPEPVNIQDFMHRIKTIFLPRANAKNILLEFIYKNTIPTLNIDSTRLSQIMTNLLGNAVKFVDQGYIRILLDGETNRSDQFVLNVKVEDTGIGIPQNKLETIFDKFGQADATTTKKYGGTGLGLAISKKLVEMMGGNIDVKSVVGEGTTFTFNIPCDIIEDAIIPTTKKAVQSKTGEDKRVLNARILLVENEFINQMVATDMLESMKCKVDLAQNGQEAIDKVGMANPPYDIVLMDCMMPVMDGFDATKAIRKLEAEGKITHTNIIIAMTANAMAEEKEQCIEVGMNDYLSKPVKTEILYNKIKEYMN